MNPVLPAGQWYAEVTGSREVAGLGLTRTRFPAGHQAPRHSHERAFFCLTLQGAFTESYGRTAQECRPSTLLFHPPADPHSDRTHAEGCCFIIEIGVPWLDRLRQSGIVLEEPVAFEGRLPALAARLYREWSDPDEASGLAIEGLALEMLAEASRRNTKVLERGDPRWLKQARELVAARFSENLTLDEIAAAVGVHPVHLARTFRQRYHRTLGDYIRELRLEFATRELCGSDTPLLEIALAAGYCDQSHFSTSFKRHTGMSPGRFRAAFRRR